MEIKMAQKPNRGKGINPRIFRTHYADIKQQLRERVKGKFRLSGSGSTHALPDPKGKKK